MTSRHKITCPKCGKENDAQTNPDDEATVPEPGDLSICLSCGHLTVFALDDDDRFVARELTEEEQAEVAADENVQRILAARAKVVGHAR